MMGLASIRLFKAVEIRSKRKKECSPLILKETIKRGFIFSPMVISNYSESQLRELIKLVEEVFGITSEKVNASFHKSWKKVKEADIEQLIVEQIAHYLTTYGKKDPEGYMFQKEYLENWGVDNLSERISRLEDFHKDRVRDKDYIYIPKEILDIPDIDVDEIKLVVIKGYTKQELKDKLLKLLNSGIALKEDTINDVVDVALFIGIDEKDIEIVKNKEVRIILYNYLNLVPENPVEFLRYVVYTATDETLLIKSKELIGKIKEGKNIKVIKLFKDYGRKYELKRLAEIFLRFKPIFLAFRTNQEMKSIINKTRKLAIHYHRPMKEDYLNKITARIKSNNTSDVIRINVLDEELNKVNIFRKIRLAYALKFRTKDVDSVLYRIRNGKAWATETEKYNIKQKNATKIVLEVVLDSIVKDVSKNVKGKKIYIPDYINYSLPATEKQFTGNLPSGTYISIPKDMIFGIHWENIKPYMIDLDLSLISQSKKYGWDADYRNEEGNILYSGDITDAPKPKGATELFYVKKQLKDSFIFFLNYYNYNAEVKVPFKIIVAKEKAKDFGNNYMVNPNNIVSVVQSEISQKQKILGLLITTMKESRFYFAETSIGRSITSSNSKVAENSRKYLISFYQNSIEFKDILIKAGAKFVDSKDKRDIDLSPESLEKDSILNLLL